MRLAQVDNDELAFLHNYIHVNRLTYYLSPFPHRSNEDESGSTGRITLARNSVRAIARARVFSAGQHSTCSFRNARVH